MTVGFLSFELITVNILINTVNHKYNERLSWSNLQIFIAVINFLSEPQICISLYTETHGGYKIPCTLDKMCTQYDVYTKLTKLKTITHISALLHTNTFTHTHTHTRATSVLPLVEDPLD